MTILKLKDHQRTMVKLVETKSESLTKARQEWDERGVRLEEEKYRQKIVQNKIDHLVDKG